MGLVTKLREAGEAPRTAVSFAIMAVIISIASLVLMIAAVRMVRHGG